MKSYDTIMHISLHTQVSDIQLTNIIYKHILLLNMPWYPLALHHTETKQLSCWGLLKTFHAATTLILWAPSIVL